MDVFLGLLWLHPFLDLDLLESVVRFIFHVVSGRDNLLRLVIVLKRTLAFHRIRAFRVDFYLFRRLTLLALFLLQVLDVNELGQLSRRGTLILSRTALFRAVLAGEDGLRV